MSSSNAKVLYGLVLSVANKESRFLDVAFRKWAIKFGDFNSRQYKLARPFCKKRTQQHIFVQLKDIGFELSFFLQVF